MTNWADKAKEKKEGGSFASRVVESQLDLLQLVTGKDSTGRNAWYYLLVENKQKLAVLAPALKGRTVDLTEFGEIIESGYGEEPPEYVTERVKKRFNL